MTTRPSPLVSVAKKIRRTARAGGETSQVRQLIHELDVVMRDLGDHRDYVVALIYKGLLEELVRYYNKKRTIGHEQRLALFSELVDSLVAAPNFFDDRDARLRWLRHIHRFAALYRDAASNELSGSEVQSRYATVDGIAVLIPNGRQEMDGGDPVKRVRPSLPLTLTVPEPDAEAVTTWLWSSASQWFTARHAVALCVLNTSPYDNTPPEIAAAVLAVSANDDSSSVSVFRFDDGRFVGPEPKSGTRVVLVGGESRQGRRISSIVDVLRQQFQVDVPAVLTLVDFQLGADKLLNSNGIHLTAYRTVSQLAPQLREAYFRSVATEESHHFSIEKGASLIHNQGEMGKDIEKDLRLPEVDSWSRLWVDPALRNLGRWLTGQERDDLAAERTVSRVWSFYSDVVIPTYKGYPPMALLARRNRDGQRDVTLRLPRLQRLSSASKITDELAHGLERFERSPLPNEIHIHVEVSDAGESTLEGETIGLSETDRQQFLGIYKDDLRAELATLIGPVHFAEWLSTPRDQFGGHRPIDLLSKPGQDRLLRDLVLEAKYGLVA